MNYPEFNKKYATPVRNMKGKSFNCKHVVGVRSIASLIFTELRQRCAANGVLMQTG